MLSFFRNLSFIVLLNLLVKPVYILGIEVSVQNVVGPEGYGIFFAILNSAYLFQILNDFGLQIFNNRKVAQDRVLATSLLADLLILKAGLAVVFIVCVVCFGLIAGYGSWITLLIIVCFNLVLVSTVLLVRSSISGLGHYKTDSTLSVLDKVLMILICGALLLWAEHFTIYHFVIAQSVSLVIALVTALIILSRKVHLEIRWARASTLRKLFRASMPYALAIFLMSMYTRLDGVMIEQIADNGAYQAGLYAAGFRLLDAATMVAFLFAVLLLPMYSSLLHKLQDLRTLMAQGARLMIGFTVTASVLCFVYRAEIMQLLYDDATPAWESVFGLLILSLNGLGLMYIFGTYLTARGVMKQLNIIYAVFVALNFLLNLLLIPQHGAWGAAIATLTTQTLAGIVLTVVSIREVSLRIDRISALRVVLFIPGAFAIAYGSTILPEAVHWLLRAVIALAAITVIMILMHIVTLADLRTLPSMRK